MIFLALHRRRFFANFAVNACTRVQSPLVTGPLSVVGNGLKTRLSKPEARFSHVVSSRALERPCPFRIGPSGTRRRFLSVTSGCDFPAPWPAACRRDHQISVRCSLDGAPFMTTVEIFAAGELLALPGRFSPSGFNLRREDRRRRR